MYVYDTDGVTTVEMLIVHNEIHGQNVMHYRKWARLRFSQGPGIS